MSSSKSISRTRWSSNHDENVSLRSLRNQVYTYSLIEHNHRKNISLWWVLVNQIHLLAYPAQARWGCQSPINTVGSNSCTCWTKTTSKNVRLWWALRGQYSRTAWLRTTGMRFSTSDGPWESEITYLLIKHNHGNVSLQQAVRNQIYGPTDPAQVRQECQSESATGSN